MRTYKVTGYDLTWDNIIVRKVTASSQEEAEALAKQMGLAFACRFEVEENGRRY
jgi:hypothetical protein